jgi:Zn-dependent protease with chaperone function
VVDPAGQPLAVGSYFDGLSPQRFAVSVALDGDGRGLRISGDTLAEDALWPLADIREHRDQALRHGGVFGCFGKGEARLIVEGADTAAAVRALCPNLKSRDMTPRAWRRLAVWSAGAVASVLLIVFVIIPALANTLALLIPVRQEVALGRSVVGQIERMLGSREAGDLICSSPGGDTALQKMTARLTAQVDMPYDLEVRVLDHPMPNAFAVPGGQIVLFSGLLAEATSPEMVAGVLAHELGHVVNRDPTRLMLRSAGSAGILGMLLGDFTGGAAILVVTDQLVSAQYQQGAEANADAFAHRVLAEAGLPSAPLGDFFRLIKKKYGDLDGLLSHLASHPELAGRAQKADAADVTGGDFTPVLSDAEWQALRGICGTAAPAPGKAD